MGTADLKSIVASKGYELAKNRLNFVGLRSAQSKPNKFDDEFFVQFIAPVLSVPHIKSTSHKVRGFQRLYNFLNQLDNYSPRLKVDGIYGPKTEAALEYYASCYEGKACSKGYEITTTSGVPYLLKPLTKLGAAVLKPGVWKYMRGRHKDQQAFVQAAPVTVYRDNDKDQVAEKTDVTQTGYFGINIHRRRFGMMSDLIGRWSAGCQVFRFGNEFQEVVDLADSFSDLGIQTVYKYYLIEL